MDMQEMIEIVNKNERWWDIDGYLARGYWNKRERERTICKAEFDTEKNELLLSVEYGLVVLDARDFHIIESKQLGTGDSAVLSRITIKGPERHLGRETGKTKAKLVLVNRKAEDEYLLRRTGYYVFRRQRWPRPDRIDEREESWLRAAWLGGAKAR